MPREQLEKQCSSDAASFPQSSFRGATVRSAISDPDVFQSGGSSSEYVYLLAMTVGGHP